MATPNPFTVDGFEITRLDFFVQADGTTIVQKLAQTPFSRDQHVILATEQKPVDLDKALAYCRQHGYTTRQWPAVRQNGNGPILRPAGARAWKADQPWPVRTAGQINKLRQQLGLLGHSLNLAFDL